MELPEKLDIPHFPMPSAAELADSLLNALPAQKETSDCFQERTSVETILTKALIANANQAWRIATTALDTETGEPKEELRTQDIRKIAKAVESLMEIFEGIGLRIIDRVGKPFDAGLPDQVVTEEPREGITKDQVIRTIRPTIVWNGTMVQRGEIDIAVPAKKQ